MKRFLLKLAGWTVSIAIIVAAFAFLWPRLLPQFTFPSQSEIIYQATAAKQLREQQIAKQSQEIQGVLDGFVKKYPDQFGIVATDLVTTATASVNADEQMVAASLYKMFVGYGIYKKIDAGELKATSPTKGNERNVRECLRIMIVVSDNDCGYALGTMVGWAKLDTDLAAMGLKKTKVNNYADAAAQQLSGDKLTSAADIALFVKKLYQGELLSEASTRDYISILKANEMNTWLPSGLPSSAVVAHKTGALYDLVHDAGVVYTDKGDYLLVVMSRDWPNPVSQPPRAFADISRQLWDYFTASS